ncbi:MAG: RluA family pseudouridine synthase [Chitinivibrionia bacterium]|nr:RluA family pseudouridine synthase [Chitinivibrionia bacterium]
MKLKAKVPLIYNGFTLLDYVSERFDYLSKDEWRKRIEENRHSRNGAILQEDSIVFHLDEICYDMPDVEEEPANLDYKIIMQTKDFLAIDKPPNLTVHKSKMNFRNNLIFQLRETHEPRFPTADSVNRLDKNTSGIVLIALNKSALRKLSLQFSNHTIKKTYFAIVVGTPNPASGTILASIGRLENPSAQDTICGRFCAVDAPNPKFCETEYETVKSVNGHSLVKLYPKTGRTHQLRIHLAHIGTPIVGDIAYGFEANEYRKFCAKNNIVPIESDRHLLHCSAMEFLFNGEIVSVNSELPKNFEI